VGSFLQQTHGTAPAGPGMELKSMVGPTDWLNRRSRGSTCVPQRASPMLPPCSSSPRKPPPRSAQPMSKRANCRPPSRCADCSLASPTTSRHGHAPEPSPAGHHGPRRLVRSPRYAFVEAGLGRRRRDRTRPRWNGAARRGGQRTSRPLILSWRALERGRAACRQFATPQKARPDSLGRRRRATPQRTTQRSSG
jgi:hypothetical protein